MGPVQVRGEVLARRRAGAYHLLEVVAPGVAEAARPGQFVAVRVGGPVSGLLLPRAFAIYRATPARSYAGTVQFLVSVRGAGTEWLAGVRQGEQFDVVGPLGTPFPLPTAAVGCVLVGGGYGSAPLFGLAEALRARDCRVDLVLGAATADRVFGEQEAKRTAASVTVTTEDGSSGVQGMVSDVLPDVVERAGALAVYACGPMPMLHAVSEVAASFAIPCHVAVEEAMACGIGVCMTCVLPVAGADGITRMTRSCVDGPVFLADRVRWDDLDTVPADALGAAGPGAAGPGAAGPGAAGAGTAVLGAIEGAIELDVADAGVAELGVVSASAAGAGGPGAGGGGLGVAGWAGVGGAGAVASAPRAAGDDVGAGSAAVRPPAGSRLAGRPAGPVPTPGPAGGDR
jgi:dihydroorotate dehydrogenase electron transfer subunit